jgi:MFS transporter, putative metabolite:H+ symporter
MVAAGVALHLPMFLMGRHTGYRLVGMPMGNGMLAGMALIVLGVLAAAYGLLPRHEPQRASHGRIVPPEDAPLAAGAIAIPTAVSLLLVFVFGHETRGRDLREMETEALILEA